MSVFDNTVQAWFTDSNNLFLEESLTRCTGLWVWAPLLLAALVVIFRDRPFKESLLTVACLGVNALLACVAVSFAVGGFNSLCCITVCSVCLYLIIVFKHLVTSLLLSLVSVLSIASAMFNAVDLPSEILSGVFISVLVSLASYFAMLYARGLLSLPVQKYYSSAYTKSGYSSDDMYFLLSFLSLTLLYVLF